MLKINLLTHNNNLENNFIKFFEKIDLVDLQVFHKYELLIDNMCDFCLIDEEVMPFDKLLKCMNAINQTNDYSLNQKIGIILLSNQININKYIEYYKNKVLLIINKLNFINKDLLIMFYFHLVSLFAYKVSINNNILFVKDLSINLVEQKIYIKDKFINNITNNEFMILKTLLIYKNTPVLKSYLYRELSRGNNYYRTKNRIIDVIICNIRKKLKTYSSDIIYIKTIWNQGYIMQDE